MDRDVDTDLEIIVELRVGSHLHGTDTPQSDLDLKGVYLPNAADILLQRVRPSLTFGAPKAHGQRNAPGDVDREYYSLQRYLALLAEGQTVALDMLFAPDVAMTRTPAPLWREIQAHAPRLVSRRASAFLKYCRHQADRYGIKGSRAASVRRVLALLTAAEQRLGTTARLGAIAPELETFAGTAHVTLVDLPMPGERIVRHLELCGRKMPFTATIKAAREMAQRLVDAYGARALQAERNEGIDWKALSHAVRVGHEAIELLGTGRLTLPLPCAAHLRRIKAGEIAYDAVADEIERLLVEVEAAAASSTLPPAPDLALIDALVARAYRRRIEEG